MNSLALLFVLAAAPTATESSYALSPPPLVQAEVPTPKLRDAYSRWGLMVDAGVPDGAGVSGMFRPLKWLRLQAGVTTNTAAFGLRGGATLVPFDWLFKPTLTLELGNAFEGNAGWFLGAAGPAELRAVLSRVSYLYGNAHLGLEVGGRRFGFFLRAGLTYIDVTLSGFQAAIGHQARVAPPHLRASLPSLKLGFVLFIG